ncbi:hypothetical protein E3Q18_01914 [Wallemia mellicola]|uniref:Uncharacterized protein n=1 Tax=Wallemia mellicola TaxID=1708541 RepID=A0A4T0RB12_9BASI|nr:hypothetical protein E3Q24_02183 [Wallemia mellicola]TIB98727.1 hypothetical protein E3Q18_01914 [Wallemia mellicola]TIC34218.1 hypothetical protein E3Q10_00416 [Wallemia mellicola]TIC54803.1 hypothetical protein E3Q04_02229 [Wallemia mellicola]
MSYPQEGLIEGFNVGDFTFNLISGPAASDDDLLGFKEDLGFDPPMLLFPHNAIKIAHNLSNFTLAFYARPALHLIDKSGAEAKRVAYAFNEGAHAQLPKKSHDWTYTTTYSGNSTRSFNGTPYRSIASTPSHSHNLADNVISHHTLTFFEDDLGSAGYTTLRATLIVYDDSFEVLQRHFLRVNNILFRIFDCTFSHKFGSWEINKHCRGWEGRWNEVFMRLPTDYQNINETSSEYQDAVKDVLVLLSPLESIRRAKELSPSNQMLRSTSGDSVSSASMSSRSGSRIGFAARVLLSRHNSHNSTASTRRRRKHPPGALSFSTAKAKSNPGSMPSSCVSPMSSGCCSPSAISGAGTGWNGVGRWSYRIHLSDMNDEFRRELPSQFPPENTDENYEMDDWEYERRRSFAYNNMFNDFSSCSSSDDDGYAYDQMDVAQQLTKRLERFSRQYPERLVDRDDYDNDDF